MEQRENFKKYLDDLRALLAENFDGRFYYSGGSDIAAARELFVRGIEPLQVMMILEDERISGRFSLSDVTRLVLDKFTSPVKEAELFSPYQKIERLRRFVSSLLLELEAEDMGLVERLDSLMREEDLLKIERELYAIEEAFYKLLELYSPHSRECARWAKKMVEEFSFYWKEKVLEATEKALFKECLKKKHGIPEFTAL